MPHNAHVFRFAPSPNGLLHLGHARSALLGFGMARAIGGQFLIRIEDIDIARCNRVLEAAILNDLNRLGLMSDGPIRRQSEHFADYAEALARLKSIGLVYASFLSRSDIKREIAVREAGGDPWPRDPDGAPIYPGTDRDELPELAARRIAAGEQVIWRLDMARAIALVGQPGWQDSGADPSDSSFDLQALRGRRVFRAVAANPARWGDVILARADVPTSYHLSVVVDDALQGVTDVVRGADLFAATSVHRLLQELLGFPAPQYHHHSLMRDATGRKLAKSEGDAGLGFLLDQGLTADDIRRLVGLG
jgi:glutamyl-Q tRNA(Asp) synthetase